jgi:thermostable 8-oxoguanine DNA glycosylase
VEHTPRLNASDPTALAAERLDAALVGLQQIAEPFLKSADELFTEKRKSAETALGVWFELIYCILAGSQVPMETARRAHSALVLRWKEQMLCGALTEPIHPTEIAEILKRNGYRYHRTKAEVIARTAEFSHTRYADDLRSLIKGRRVGEIEQELRQIKGIGKKIANHWLRNVGLDTCTVDIHLKRLFNEIGLVPNQPEAETKTADFYAIISYIRKLATRLNVPLAEAQYALWLGARKRYSETERQTAATQPRLH